MICHTNGFPTIFHMSEKVFGSLLVLLCENIIVSYMKSKVSTQNNDSIYPHLILERGLPFMGGEYSKKLADTYDISISRFCRVIKIFLRTVDSYDDHRILVYVEFMTSHLLVYVDNYSRIVSTSHKGQTPSPQRPSTNSH